MFANFELWSGGLLEHSAKPRLPRSTTGCMPCRRTRKKCDERHPTCGRCLRRGQGECVWPDSAIPSPSSSSSGSMSSLSLSPCSSELSRACSSVAFEPLSTPPLCHFNSGASSILGQSYDVPGVPVGHARELICQANRTIHGAYFDEHYTIFVPFQPLLAKFRPYAYTWLALGAARLAQQTAVSAESPWHAISLECHSKAVRGLHRHLQSSVVPAEWALCSLLLLHIFEKFGDESHSPSDAHVAVARSMFTHRFTSFPPTEMRHILQLESLIYRIAVTRMFRRHPAISQHEYGSLDDLIDIWSAAPITCGLWQHSLFIGLRPPIFHVIFKLSILLRLLPLEPCWVAELDNIDYSLQQHLGSYEVSSTNFEQTMLDLDRKSCAGDSLTIEAQSHAAHTLYACACRIVAAQLRSSTPTQQQQYHHGEDHARRSSRLGVRLLEYLLKAAFLSPVLIWPAFVIGLTTSGRGNQEMVEEYINGLTDLSGSRATTSVMRVLHLAWSRADAGGAAAIDTLSDYETLSTIFI